MSVLGELLHERRARPSFSRLVNLGGVVLSVGLLVGTVVWGVRVATRDVSGVPVVRALEGPSRVAPADAEGVVVENQGLSVNQVQADGAAGTVAEQIQLAPVPGDLRESDLSPAEIAAANITPQAEPLPVGLSGTDSAVLAVLDPPEGDGAAVLPVPEPVAIISRDIPGVTDSPIPPRRPAGLAERAAATSDPATPAATPVTAPLAEAPAVAAVVEVDQSSLPVGARLVQLGSFDSADLARGAWERLAKDFPDLMKGRSRIVEKGNIGAAEFWRLRAAGFESREDAQRFCAAIDDGNQRICIPVAID